MRADESFAAEPDPASRGTAPSRYDRGRAKARRVGLVDDRCAACGGPLDPNGSRLWCSPECSVAHTVDREAPVEQPASLFEIPAP